MVATKYTYSIASDITAAVCDANQLTLDIVAGALSTALGHIDVSGDVLDVWFVDALSAGDKTSLDGIVLAHAGAPTALRIAQYAPVADHRTLDYKSGLTERLHKKTETMFRGEVRQVRYFTMPSYEANPGDENLWDEVLRVDVTYNRDAQDLATDRTTTRTWYRSDGSAHPTTKVTKKHYAPFEQMLEAVRRRQNVLDSAALTILGLLVQTETAGNVPDAEDLAQAFTSLYDTELNNFVRVGSTEFKDAVTADATTTWLDNDIESLGYPATTTIRDVILGEVKSVQDPAEAWQ